MITPATPQLLDLAEASRGTEWRDQLERALIAARNAGWDWPRTLLAAVRLIAREDASPRELTEAARSPLERPQARGDYEAGLALARQALARGTNPEPQREGMSWR